MKNLMNVYTWNLAFYIDGQDDSALFSAVGINKKDAAQKIANEFKRQNEFYHANRGMATLFQHDRYWQLLRCLMRGKCYKIEKDSFVSVPTFNGHSFVNKETPSHLK